MFPRDNPTVGVPASAAAQSRGNPFGQQNDPNSGIAEPASPAATPTAPPPSPQPPAFGTQAQASSKRQRSKASQSGGFGSTILGLNSAPAPLGTKTLLGQ